VRAIFISYRREDAEGQAGRLFKDLVQRFGEKSVFMDVAAIEPGRDFRKAIDQHVASCGVLLAIIGKSWAELKDENGRRRLEDPSDFVRLETASALKRDIPVVPVLVHGAQMPRAEQLPPDLQDLAYRNAIELTHARWDSDVSVLVKALSPYVATAESEAARPVAAAPASANGSLTASTHPAPGHTNADARAQKTDGQRSKVAAIGIAAVAVAAVAGYLFSRTDPDSVEAGKTVEADKVVEPMPAVPPQTTSIVKPPAPDKPAGSPAARPEAGSASRPGGNGNTPSCLPRAAQAAPDAQPVSSTAGRCASFGVTDWDGDGHQDLIARQNSTNELWLYPGQSRRGPSRIQRVQIGNAWRPLTAFGAVDWDHDGRQDLIVRNNRTTNLMLHAGQGKRAPGLPPVEIGVGWTGHTFFGAADWDRDGHQDIVTRHEATGNLMLYPGESVRRMSNVQPTNIGVGWQGYTPFGMGDWDRDGHQDIVTRNDTTGDLMLYPGESSRGMSQTQPTKIGVGWNDVTFFGMGDWDRDGHQDIVVRNDSTGDLMLYPGESSRSMSNAQPVKIGSSF
jgi:hypothetical protein